MQLTERDKSPRVHRRHSIWWVANRGDCVANIGSLAHQVQIESSVSDAAALSVAIREAGYTAVSIASGAAMTERSMPRSGCCCC